jgi:hypothetical protein
MYACSSIIQIGLVIFGAFCLFSGFIVGALISFGLIVIMAMLASIDKKMTKLKEKAENSESRSPLDN